MSRQLALPLRLIGDIGFEGFLAGENAEAVAVLKAAAQGEGEHFLSLWGGTGCGKSHLLQAACRLADRSDHSAFYLSLAEAPQSDPVLLQGLEGMDLVAIDDIDRIAGDPAWEEALYRLYNAIRQAGGRLLVAFRPPLAELPIGLPDLKSRLAWGPAYRLLPLGDADKGQVLQRAAVQRGLSLPDETLNYLMHHYSRDLPELLRLLDRLDQASLEAQRRLTLPFVRQWLLTPGADK
ncbi:MAG: DnaA regulatory inactivator Hda [Gammaproteobacteria bacterium]|nr:DnaA regulatory inactivator Hda [Gammaproteobacteria bacterium]MBU1654594.1 DnaA regulatory inactivator Hda [Gammaproteobacteria bacterium]MBU1962322.1 DnaA regulatory inactivator Hda [Gammaproteobacteria bacterium]